MRCPTRTWCASNAPICSIRWRPIRRSRRCCMHSCRTSSSITPTPTPWSVWSIRTTAPSFAARSMAARMGFVPYVMPGFRLAKVAAEVFQRDPKVEGFILDKHGIFTFGESAREAYERMIETVTLAETRLQKNRKAVFVTAQMPPAGRRRTRSSRHWCAARAASRTASREGAWRRLDPRFPHRATRSSISSTARTWRATARKASSRRTPPSGSRTHRCCSSAPAAGKIDEFARAARAAATGFMDNYKTYFARQNARVGGTRTMLDPQPRVVLVPGLGLFGLGRTKKDAAIAADLAEAFDRMHHRCRGDRPLQVDLRGRHVRRRILVAGAGQARPGQDRCRSRVRSPSITGAGGAIGAATAKAFAAAGAEVALLDIDERRPRPRPNRPAATALRGSLRRHQCCGRARRPSTRCREFRRRRHRRIERRRGVAGPHRRSGRGDVAQELRAEFLRPSARRAGRRARSC